MSTAAVSVNGATEAAVLEAIQGKIEPVRTSREYVAGMALVALVMILLPLVYLGLIALVAALLWYHATHNISVFAHASGRNAKGAVAMYAAPLALGGIVLLFMIKPLFAPRRRESVVEVDSVRQLGPDAFGVVADQRQIPLDQQVPQLFAGLILFVFAPDFADIAVELRGHKTLHGGFESTVSSQRR